MDCTTTRNLPYRPYCTDELGSGLIVRPRDKAIKYNYLQLNPPCTQWTLTFDVDYLTTPDIAAQRGLPDPTWIILNRANLHSHVIYALSEPVCTTDIARLAPLRYAAAIEQAYTERLRADPGYAGLISKNPWKADHWQVLDNSARAYALGELASCVDLTKIAPRKKGVRPEVVMLGRNCEIFEEARAWAYRAIRRHWEEGASDWEELVYGHCLGLNELFRDPLGPREVHCIARSIAKWTWRRFRPGEFAAWQRRRAQKRWGIRRPQGVELLKAGSSVASVAQELKVTDRTARRWKAAAVPQDERPKAQGIELLKAGATVASVAKELDVPERTVRNWKAAVVSQGDRPTLTSARPWKELGISRATWYKLRNDANR